MKQVLYLTSHFSPDAHVRSKRSTKVCKYLQRNGWLPVVLTKQVCGYHRIDGMLNRYITSEVQIES